MVHSILLVEDDPLIGQGLELGLKNRGLTVEWVDTGRQVTRLLQLQQFDVLVLDLGLPDIDGIDLLKQIRERQIDIPIIILTARDSIHDRVAGLDYGADDYLAKPASTDELAARIRAVARRRDGRSQETCRVGGLELNPLSRELRNAGQLVQLTPIEYLIIETLIRREGVVVSIDVLLSVIEESLHMSSAQSVQVHIHSLRKKISPETITTIRGVGYRLG